MRSSSRWVVDASVALKWYLRDEQDLAAADQLYNAFTANLTELIAPHFIRYEVMNALEVARIQGRIDGDQAMDALDQFLSLRIYQGEDDDELLRRSMVVSRRYVITPYDAVYLALAEETSSLFVTADRRLYGRIDAQTPIARWLGDVGSIV